MTEVPMMPMTKTESGFSLIELVMVLVVIGLVLSAGMPAFGAYRRTLLLKQVKSQLIQDLRAARQMAVTRHVPVVVSFRAGGGGGTSGTYSIHGDLNRDGFAQSDEPMRLRQLPTTCRVTETNFLPPDSLKFDSSGILSPGTSGGRVVFDNGVGRCDTLLVSGSGMVYKP